MRAPAMLAMLLAAGFTATTPATLPVGEPAPAFAPTPAIYHDGWIDLDKNGRKDLYEDARAPIDARVEDLLARMRWRKRPCSWRRCTAMAGC